MIRRETLVAGGQKSSGGRHLQRQRKLDIGHGRTGWVNDVGENVQRVARSMLHNQQNQDERYERDDGKCQWNERSPTLMQLGSLI
jgi:hypothetical protein